MIIRDNAAEWVTAASASESASPTDMLPSLRRVASPERRAPSVLTGGSYQRPARRSANRVQSGGIAGPSSSHRRRTFNKYLTQRGWGRRKGPGAGTVGRGYVMQVGRARAARAP